MAHLKLGVLGSLQIMWGDKPITKLESAKARALLAYLAVEADHAHRRDALPGLLWPDCPEDAARHNLRQALFNIRQALGDQKAKRPHLLITRDEIRFNTASDYTLDVEQFNAHLSASDKHAHADLSKCDVCAEHLQQAVDLYRGKFLQEFFLEDSAEFEEWALVQREGLHQRACDALAHLADYSEYRGDLAAARAHVQRQLGLDPWREQAHAQMIRLYALQGDRAAAMAQYESCRRVLADELGVEPSTETRTLYEQVIASKLQPAPASPPQHSFPNLPTQLSPFVGRAQEQADLAALISNPDCRLLTLVGPGGIGKTRLALQVSGRCRSAFPHGAAFIPLASVRSVDAIVPTILAALDLVPHGHVGPKLQLLDSLREKQALLVLDNAEHLLVAGSLQETGDPLEENAAGLFLDILQGAPGIKLLVTSREQLGLHEEWIYEVKGLAIPAGQAEDAKQFDAVALFVERARRAQAGFRLAEEDKAALVRLCQLVDGMPLAIELAAAWVRTLSLDEIVREIERNLDFLSATWRDLPDRHKSLRAIFDHSWDGLSAEEQTTLSRLSVFRGNFHRRAAEQVAHASLPILASLVAKSLIQRRGGGRAGSPNERGHYEIHELVRRYAQARLIERDQCDTACRDHFHYFLHFAEEGTQNVLGKEQVVWLDRFEEEHNNLRAALEWSLLQTEMEDGAAGEESLRLANAMTWFWNARDYWTEGRSWLTQVLSRTGHLTASAARGKALCSAAVLAEKQGDLTTAKSLLDESLAVATKIDDRLRIAVVMNSYGFIHWKQKDYAAATIEYEKGLALFRELGSRYGIAESLDDLAHVAVDTGDLPAARNYLEESLTVYRELGDRHGLNYAMADLGLVAYLQGQQAMARCSLEQALAGARESRSIAATGMALSRLGDVARASGDYAEAGKLYTECLNLYHGRGDRSEVAHHLHNLAYVELAHGNHSRALDLFRDALRQRRDLRYDAGIAECLEGISAVMIKTDRAAQGARLGGAAQALREKVGAVLWPADQLEHDRHMALLRSALDEQTLAAAWAEGSHMTSDAVLLDALMK